MPTAYADDPDDDDDSDDNERPLINPSDMAAINRAVTQFSSFPGYSERIWKAAAVPGYTERIRKAATVPGYTEQIRKAAAITGMSGAVPRQCARPQDQAEGAMPAHTVCAGMPRGRSLNRTGRVCDVLHKHDCPYYPPQYR